MSRINVRSAQRSRTLPIKILIVTMSPLPKQMQALRVEHGDKAASIKDTDVPEINDDEVLVQVAACHLAPDVFGLVAAGRLQPLPMTLGHKIAGVIAKVGASVRDLQVGTRVRVDPNVNCGKCMYCNTNRDALCDINGVMGFFSLRQTPLFDRYHNGGLAEYVRAPVACIDVLADHLSFDAGAKVHDLANAAAVLRRAAFDVGSTVLVTAATGGMGTAVVKMAPYFGVRRLVLVGRSKKRLEAVRAISGLECLVVALEDLEQGWQEDAGLTKAVRELVPEGVDSVIDFTPQGTELWQVVRAVRIDGSVVFMGGNHSILPISSREMQLHCWRILGHRNHSRQDSKLVLQLLESKVLQVDELITHHFKLADWERAIMTQKEGKEPAWTLSLVTPQFEKGLLGQNALQNGK